MRNNPMESYVVETLGPLWRCDRCGALNSKRYLRVWHCYDEQYTLCFDCSTAIVYLWLQEHEREIWAAREALMLEGSDG